MGTDVQFSENPRVADRKERLCGVVMALRFNLVGVG